MKRFITAVLAAFMAVSVTVPAMAEPTGDNTDSAIYGVNTRFTDIYTDDFAWARIYINAMAQKGLISGYEDGTFRPDNDVTRLEGLALFARAMGSNDPANADILTIAHEKYDSVVGVYGLSWGTDEIVYLMYKGALKKSDLDTYLRDGEKNEPLKRYEATIIITKAMGGENDALSELGIVLDYTDVRDVPSHAIQYVEYATEMGIVEGMDDGTFSPNTAVKRSQMAVMLSRTVDKTDYSFLRMKIVGINTTTRVITASSSDGREVQYEYTDDTVMKSRGNEVQPKNFDAGVDAVLTLSGANLVSVDSVSKQPDRTVTGRFYNYASLSGRSVIRITPDGETSTQSYECAPDVSVIYDGSPATVRSFMKDDIITLNLVNGVIAKITGESKTADISGAIVEDIDIYNDVTITISHGNEEYNGKSYKVSSNVSVKKNDVPCDLDEIYKGDKVNLTLEYGVITKISASSSKKVVEGIIQSLTISGKSTMEVKVKDKIYSYAIPSDVEILINNEEGTLYDFRVNDHVKLSLESDTITKIVATTTQESSTNVTGVVTGINVSYGLISVLPSGASEAKQILCNDKTKFITVEDGRNCKITDIKIGQTVDIKGAISNGQFIIGKLVIIMSE